MDQQGTDTYLVKPVQAYARPTDTLDPHIRTSLHMGRPAVGGAPLNFYGRKTFRMPPPEMAAHDPSGLSGVYRWTGPVLAPYGIEAKMQIPNL